MLSEPIKGDGLEKKIQPGTPPGEPVGDEAMDFPGESKPGREELIREIHELADKLKAASPQVSPIGDDLCDWDEERLLELKDRLTKAHATQVDTGMDDAEPRDAVPDQFSRGGSCCDMLEPGIRILPDSQSDDRHGRPAPDEIVYAGPVPNLSEIVVERPTPRPRMSGPEVADHLRREIAQTSLFQTAERVGMSEDALLKLVEKLDGEA